MPELIVKSKRSTTPALVRFINKSYRTINIVWINFDGEFIPHKTLIHNQFVDVNTYTTHPWLFMDTKTRDLMKVNDKNLFYATPVRCPRTGRVGRSCIVIHLPLYSLRINALITVRNLLQNAENISCLELPVELKNDLKKSFNNKNVNRYARYVPEAE